MYQVTFVQRCVDARLYCAAVFDLDWCCVGVSIIWAPKNERELLGDDPL